MRNIPGIEVRDGEQVRTTLESAPQRLEIEQSGCYALKDEEASTIKIFNREGLELFGMSQKVVPFESKALFLALQIYMTGYNSGRSSMQQEARSKVEKIVELLKMCL